MRQAFRALSLGLALLLGSLALELLGSQARSLSLLVLSFAIAIAGAFIALRGLVDFFGELV